ncbi:hypothetical protein H206_05284 [Candidatus Electrothrix aarhusensis]|uniref:Uncharacterized protein n=1 Tax=Candidatus Electrothrix aarhusensis TaxID=1859131 RepID=A0A3S4TDG6_9BACT|nr:hypothetical protein H206_05284 [Candidatus Electrothrix aarhusensis]
MSVACVIVPCSSFHPDLPLDLSKITLLLVHYWQINL